MVGEIDHQGAAGTLRGMMRSAGCARNSQLGDERVNDVRNYIRRGKLWDAFAADRKTVPADRRDRQGGYRVSQTTCCRNSTAWSSSSTRPARRFRRVQRPIVIINVQQREGTAGRLPAPLLLSLYPLSRHGNVCTRIVDVHYPGRIKQALVREGGPLTQFYCHPRDGGPEEKALDLEALDWIRLLVSDDVEPEEPCGGGMPGMRVPKLHGALPEETSRTCICSSGWHSWQDSVETNRIWSNQLATFCCQSDQYTQSTRYEIC